MVDHEDGTTEDDRILLRLAGELQTEWAIGGLSSGLYFEWAAEIATRFAAIKITEEREACAKICEETWVEPGDLQVESCHEAAAKIRERSN